MKQIALVVDDSILIRHAVCRYFEERGFAVECATNGLEALQILGHIRPGIIVTDIDMPKLDGHGFIRAIRSNPQTASIPILALFPRESETGNQDGTRADYVIFKDRNIESQILQVLEKVLS